MITFLRCFIAALVAILLATCSNHKVQSSKLIVQSYCSPIDSTIYLAGNFGEPRPWHFHGGIDIKTQNREGWNVRTIADGYVSRLTVNYFGFGNAVYVTHPDGHTSVYAHLQRFADKYERLLQRTGKDTLEMRFTPTQFPVHGGDLIAISGNTGHSTGPHLHLEIHDTETWVMRDPLEFLGHLVADTVAPQAHSFMAVPMKGEGVFNGIADKQTFSFGQGSQKLQRSEITLQREFTAWGRVGFALWADDYSESTYNYYGIRHSQLLVDGREVFRSDVDSIPVSCQPEVNLWGDYDHWRQHRTWYMKSYREEGMRLPILHTGADRGIVTFNEERPYQLTYVLRDYQNNTSRYHFIVHGVPDGRVKAYRPRRCFLQGRYQLWKQCLWPTVSFNWNYSKE